MSWGVLAYTIAKEGGTPTGEHTTETLGSADCVKGLHVALIELRVNLATAFNEIKRGHCRMSEALELTVSAILFPAVNRISNIVDTNTGE